MNINNLENNMSAAQISTEQEKFNSEPGTEIIDDTANRNSEEGAELVLQLGKSINGRMALAEASRKSGTSIYHNENGPVLALVRDIKTMEARILLGEKLSDKDMRWYSESKKEYAEKYNGGIMKDVFITSIDDAKQALYEASGESLDEDFNEVKKEQANALKLLRVASAMALLSNEGVDMQSAKSYLNTKIEAFYKMYGERPDVSFASATEAQDFMQTFAKENAAKKEIKTPSKEYSPEMSPKPIEGGHTGGLENVDIQELKEIAEKPLTEQELSDRKIKQINTTKRFVPDDLLK